MELYPIQKVIHSSRNPRTSLSPTQQSKSQAISPETSSFITYKDPILAQFTTRFLQSPHPRMDRRVTESFIGKVDERQRGRFSLSPLQQRPGRDLSLSQSPSPSPGRAKISDSQRRVVVHLASEKDQDIYKVPLYQNGIYEIRKKNEEKIKEILQEKEEYRREYNMIAQRNRFKNYRSGPLLNLCVKPTHKSGRGRSDSVGSPTGKGEEGSESPVSPAKSGKYTLLSLSPVRNSPQQSNQLIEGLEAIYHRDLQRTVLMRKEKGLRPVAVVGRERGQQSGPLELRNFKYYFEDELLMGQLKNPYRKKMPFLKPVTGSRRHQEMRKLSEIETKAEVLRNLKVLNDSMRKEAKVIRLAKVKVNDSILEEREELETDSLKRLTEHNLETKQ